MISLFRSSVAMLLVTLVTGCASLRVQTDYDPATDFSALRTYAWLERPRPTTGNPAIDDNSLLVARIHDAVDRALAARGYRRLESGRPDFRVGYYVTVEKETDISIIDDHLGYYGDIGFHHGGIGFGWARAYQYDKGTLILDIVDPDGKRLLWRGSVSDDITAAGSPAYRQRQVEKAVQAILSRFPP